MRNRTSFILLIALTVLAFSCKKDNQANNSNYFLRAQKNNVYWNATGGAYFNPYHNTIDSLTLYGSNVGEHLFIAIQKNNIGNYDLDFTRTTFDNTTGDIIISNYQLDSNYPNKINITSIANQDKSIQGNFNLRFKKAYGDSSFPATITFSNGDFKVIQTPTK